MLTKMALGFVPLAAMAAVVSAASCAGTLENVDQFQEALPGTGGGSSEGCNIPDFDMEAKLTDDSAPAGCAKVGCHGAGSALDFVAPNLVGRLLVATSATQTCGTEALVDPSDPPSSVLYLKLAGSDCGAQMPFAEPDSNFTDGELACVLDWIASLEGDGAGGSGTGGSGDGGAGGGSGGGGGG
jgi:hypothetical protein